MMNKEGITTAVTRAVEMAIAEVGLNRFKQTSLFMSSQRQEQQLAKAA